MKRSAKTAPVLRKRTAKTEEGPGDLSRERIKRSSLGGDNWYETSVIFLWWRGE